MILTLSLFSMMNLFADATGYNKTYYNVIFTASSSVDDAYYLIGYEFSNNSTFGYLQSSSYDTYIGFRFANINIPTTAVIDSAYISLYSGDAINNNYYPTTIKGINNINSTGFNSLSDLTSITLLSHYVNWDMKDLEGGAWANSSDVKTVLTDIIQNIGWITNNSISFRFGSAKTVTGSRSFNTYDYGSQQYAPKIYIRYYILTPITEDDPPQIILDEYDFDVIELIDNDTETGYLTWKIYNYTSSSGFIFSNLWYNQTKGDNPAIITDTFSYFTSFSEKNTIVEYNGIYYTAIARHSDWYYFDIYKSIDNGENWSTYLTGIGGAHANLNLAIDIDPWGALSIFDSDVSGGLNYCIYNVTSNSYIKTRTSILSGTSNNVGTIYMGKTILTKGNLWFTTSELGFINFYHRTNYTGIFTKDLLKNLNPYGMIGLDSEYWETPTGINAYIIYFAYSSTYASYGSVCGRYIHSNYTLATEQSMSSIGGLSTGEPSTTRNTLTGEIALSFVFWDDRHINILFRSNGTSGTWGSLIDIYTFSSGNPSSSIEFNTKYALGLYTIITRTESGNIKILSYNKATGSVNVVGNYVSTSAYKIKAYILNKTSEDAGTIIYIITDEDGNIIWEGTTLPVVDDLPITATSVRNFLFITGLILFLAPMILWSVGGEYRSIMGIGIGLISMLTGLAFIMSITSIVL